MKTTYGFILLFLFSLTSYSQSDCPDAIIVCGDASYRGLNAAGIGVQELDFSNPCHSVEHNSLWLKILIKDGGTLGFVLTPDSPDMVVDFDFWIFGPDVPCDSIGQAVRCSTTNPLQSDGPNNLTGMNGIEPDVAEGPGTHGNSFINWMTVQDDETYYLIIDRPVGSSDFSLHWTGTATFHDLPVFNNPDDIPLELSQCDQDGVDDHATAFDITTYANMFVGSQTDVALTYHANSNDMTTGDNPLNNPAAYSNAGNPGTAYLRMTNTITGCFETLTFDLNITTDVVAGEPENLVQCDTNGNGLQVFNLSENEDEIKNGDEGTVVTYYRTQQNAIDKVGAIGPLHQNNVAYAEETIWGRLENSTGCFGHDLKSFTIKVIPLPTFNNQDGLLPRITKCDDDLIDDNSAEFDLTVFEPMFTGNQSDILFTYHTSENNAQIGLSPIGDPLTYSNTSSPQTIYVRMINTATGCAAVGTLEIEIVNTVMAGMPANLQLCDTNANGFREFNLSANDAAIKNGAQGTFVTYFASQQDAENNVGSLPSLYQNAIAYTSQVIWARLESTGCFGYDLVSFTISILPVPAFNNPNGVSLNLKQCDADGTDDNSTLFDLTQHAAMLTGNQPGVTISYFLNSDDASTGNNSITTPHTYANISSPQTIFIRMQNTVTGCFTLNSFDIEITKIIAGEPLDMSLCDTNLNGFREFNLAENEVLILNGNTNASVTYYESEADAEAENNPIGPLYQNEIANVSQLIWARLENTGGCFGYDIKSFSIIINSLPVFNHTSTASLRLEKCDSDGVDDQSTAFDLTQHEMLYMGNQEGIQFSYYTSSADAILGTNVIALPDTYANVSNPQIIYIRMANSATGCFSVSQFEIEIINPITAGDPVNLALCDFDQNGLQNFNLAANDDAVKNGIPGTKVTYFASLQDAENNTDPIPDIYRNAQPYIPQTIWARLENITGCFGFDVKSFTISILPIPVVNFDLKIKDFTRDENSITIIVPNPDLFEFALNDSEFGEKTFFEGLNPGLYTVHIRSKDGCMETSRETAILNYPKFFTPNGDTYNDFWRIPFLSFFPDAHITIFDRYGKVITAFNGKDKGWDGTYNGEALPSTDYWFMLTFTTGRTIKGHFSMLR